MAQTKDEGFNLTKATKAGRAFVKYGTIFLVVMIVGRVTWQAAVAYYKAMNPPPPPPPTQGFGALPPIEFPDQDETPESYKLEMATNTFPEFGDRMVVYHMPKNNPGLLDIDETKEIANRYGFLTEPESLDSRTLRWNRSQVLNYTFEIDVLSKNFEYTSDYMSRPELILNTNIPTKSDSIDDVKQFLSRGQLLPADVATASGEVQYLRAVGGELQEAVSVSEAQFVRVDLNRSDLQNKYPVFTPDGETGTIHAIIAAGLRSSNSVVEVIRNYWPIDYSLTHTYYLRSASDAWQTLQAGEGYVANPGTEPTAVIRNVELGYFDSFEPQTYLQPIYVFTGDNGFVGYVPALNQNQITKQTE